MKASFEMWKTISKELDNDFDYRHAKMMMGITENICKIMAQIKMSRTKLAEKMGVSRSRISEILNSPKNVTTETLLKIADALGAHLCSDDLFILEEDWKAIVEPKERGNIVPFSSIPEHKHYSSKKEEQETSLSYKDAKENLNASTNSA